ncbi:hypothetical protein [Spirosoma agri]|uniref:Uncharacterized protein n=1 Tax=Spirosoma agri TaxID=1987381 RepID=A0A6M0IQI7_9BACT|nr:hypothetical protein [Spirosoma agri]NEU70600.1 hypothetical protein [Spirosoma agri]
MAENSPIIYQVESLFWSVETELAKRWALYNIPAIFASRPLIHLRVIVKSWWQLYHESRCARLGINRQIWERNQANPVVPLDTPALVASLEGVWRLIHLEDLSTFRPLSKAEEASMCLLALLIKFYSTTDREKWRHIL